MTDERTRVYEVTQAALDRAQRFAESPNTTPGEHCDIMVAVNLARHAHEATAPLIAENAKLREALKFYANLWDDCGRRARDALEAAK